MSDGYTRVVTKTVLWAMVITGALASRGLAVDCNGNGVDDAIDVSPLSFDVVPIASGLAGPAKVLARDLDADGDVDLAMTESSVDMVTILKNDGTGSFGAPADYSTGAFPFALAAGPIGGGRHRPRRQ